MLGPLHLVVAEQVGRQPVGLLQPLQLCRGGASGLQLLHDSLLCKRCWLLSCCQGSQPHRSRAGTSWRGAPAATGKHKPRRCRAAAAAGRAAGTATAAAFRPLACPAPGTTAAGSCNGPCTAGCIAASSCGIRTGSSFAGCHIRLCDAGPCHCNRCTLLSSREQLGHAADTSLLACSLPMAAAAAAAAAPTGGASHASGCRRPHSCTLRCSRCCGAHLLLRLLLLASWPQVAAGSDSSPGAQRRRDAAAAGKATAACPAASSWRQPRWRQQLLL